MLYIDPEFKKDITERFEKLEEKIDILTQEVIRLNRNLEPKEQSFSIHSSIGGLMLNKHGGIK